MDLNDLTQKLLSSLGVIDLKKWVKNLVDKINDLNGEKLFENFKRRGITESFKKGRR